MHLSKWFACDVHTRRISREIDLLEVNMRNRLFKPTVLQPWDSSTGISIESEFFMCVSYTPLRSVSLI